MKRYQISRLYITVCIVLTVIIMSMNRLEVQAAEILATVSGTVQSGTTSEILKLSTKEGYMEIKLDAGTDTSSCKVLLPDNKISVSVSHGSDGYLHAVKIMSGGQGPGVTLDSSASATVTGTIGEKTKGDILYFNTPQGEMEIKLDTTTNTSGCSVLIVGKSYSITCMRGSDAYMHAVSISDMIAGTGIPAAGTGVPAAGTAALPGTGTAGNIAAVASSVTPAPSAQTNAATATVTGTVTERTKENLLYLSTDGGEMQLVIDNGTDSRSGVVLTPGNKLTVSCYRGSDAYMHAASIVGTKENAGAVEIDRSSPATVTGTVGKKSTESLLYLDTPQGEMQLKLDVVNSISNCKVFVSGKKLTLTCARGSDAYMHALDIVGN